MRGFQGLGLVACLAAATGACSSAGQGEMADKAGTSGSSSGGAPAENQGGGIQAGTLTAGAWDDNINFAYYLAYLQSPAVLALAGRPEVPRGDRVVIRVVDGTGGPLAGAVLEVRAGNALVFSTTTAADGTVTFYPGWAGLSAQEALSLRATREGHVGSAEVPAGAQVATVLVEGAQRPAVQALDAVLVIDSTGSMGDEMEYLKVEFEAITSSLATRFPGLNQRWGLVNYRDDGDDYVVRSQDFMTDLEAFRGKLAAQSADGGGDEPEAPERALESAVGMSWREGAVARVVFHVADAPHHEGREQQLINVIADARSLGVRIYPVAASDTNPLAEYAMRAEAQLTGGRYLFLTDDSGVGNAHAEPTIPCYFVTSLQKAMLRMVAMELTGRYEEPAAGDILRSGGNPQDGACTLTGGEQVHIL